MLDPTMAPKRARKHEISAAICLYSAVFQAFTWVASWLAVALEGSREPLKWYYQPGLVVPVCARRNPTAPSATPAPIRPSLTRIVPSRLR